MDMTKMSLQDSLHYLQNRVTNLEEKLNEWGYSGKDFVVSEIQNAFAEPIQERNIMGLHTAICVDTNDPYKTGRVRYFSPLFHDKKSTIKQLPWASPISPMGGFDDCGLSWVPPAGSKLCLIFEGGYKHKAFYIGTTWDKNRGPDGKHLWDYPIEEYYKIHEGHRKGYLSGRDDGSQVFPPWNTENYNGVDNDSLVDFEEDTEAINRTTYPNIYGFKTPQKHMLKMVDGNYKCNFRWKRVELQSSSGGLLLFKDDHLHPSGQWLNGDNSGEGKDCNDENGNPIEKAECPPDADQSTFSNPYHKHKSEYKPYKGPGTPQNNKVELEQSGVQIISPSGHTLVMSDKVEEPQIVSRNLKPIGGWESGTEDFDFGCTDKFEGFTELVSATGHKIRMDDKEEETNVRHEDNGITILTATGNKIELNDHTISCESEGSSQAGEKRGIHMRSTSNHTFDMSDVDNLQCQARKEGGVPSSTAENAYVRLRSGYGLELRMEDSNSQEETQSQSIQLFSPQYDSCCGPHIIRMQESAEVGQIFIRAGGDYVCSTEGDHYTMIGHGYQTGEDGFVRPNIDAEENADFCKGGCLGKKNMITVVSKNTLHQSCGDYLNVAENHLFVANKKILLLAGKDCPSPEDAENQEKGPCIWPVLVLQGNRIVASDRVYASASCEASCINIQHVLAGTQCPPLNCD